MASSALPWLGLVTFVAGIGWSASQLMIQLKPDKLLFFPWPAYHNLFTVSLLLLLVGVCGLGGLSAARYSRFFRIGSAMVSIGLLQMLLGNITKFQEPVWMPLIFLSGFMIVGSGLCLQSIGISREHVLPASVRAWLPDYGATASPAVHRAPGRLFLAAQVPWPLSVAAGCG